MTIFTKHAIRSTFLPLFLVLLIGCSSTEEAQEQKHFIWKAENNASIVYLVGSIHMLKESAYPLAPVFEQAFAESSTLVLEIDLAKLDMASVTQTILQKGVYTDGRTLKDVLPDSTYDLTEAKLKEIGQDITMLNSFKPWFVMLTVSALGMQKVGFEAEHGLDMYFKEKAQERGLKTGGLETLEDQVNIFDSISDEAQALILHNSLLEEDSLSTELDMLIDFWKKGDTKEVERYTVKDIIHSPDAYDALIVRRNKNWIPKLEKYLHAGDTTFVVVGAGHLVGEQGLVKLLQKEGYVVNQL